MTYDYFKGILDGNVTLYEAVKYLTNGNLDIYNIPYEDFLNIR